MAREKFCKICGRSDKKLIKELCPKHHSQLLEYNFTLDTCQRDETDTNEIVIHEEYAEISLYDNHQEEIEEKVIIDLEMVSKIKDIRWDKKQSWLHLKEVKM